MWRGHRARRKSTACLIFPELSKIVDELSVLLTPRRCLKSFGSSTQANSSSKHAGEILNAHQIWPEIRASKDPESSTEGTSSVYMIRCFTFWCDSNSLRHQLAAFVWYGKLQLRHEQEKSATGLICPELSKKSINYNNWVLLTPRQSVFLPSVSFVLFLRDELVVVTMRQLPGWREVSTPPPILWIIKTGKLIVETCSTISQSPPELAWNPCNKFSIKNAC